MDNWPEERWIEHYDLIRKELNYILDNPPPGTIDSSDDNEYDYYDDDDNDTDYYDDEVISSEIEENGKKGVIITNLGKTNTTKNVQTQLDRDLIGIDDNIPRPFYLRSTPPKVKRVTIITTPREDETPPKDLTKTYSVEELPIDDNTYAKDSNDLRDAISEYPGSPAKQRHMDAVRRSLNRQYERYLKILERRIVELDEMHSDPAEAKRIRIEYLKKERMTYEAEMNEQSPPPTKTRDDIECDKRLREIYYRTYLPETDMNDDVLEIQILNESFVDFRETDLEDKHAILDREYENYRAAKETIESTDFAGLKQRLKELTTPIIKTENLENYPDQDNTVEQAPLACVSAHYIPEASSYFHARLQLELELEQLRIKGPVYPSNTL